MERIFAASNGMDKNSIWKNEITIFQAANIIGCDVPPFAELAAKFWRGKTASELESKLQFDFAGVRPKGLNRKDFEIQTEETHGIPGLVNLFNIESPGVTASLAIADEVVRGGTREQAKGPIHASLGLA